NIKPQLRSSHSVLPRPVETTAQWSHGCTTGHLKERMRYKSLPFALSKGLQRRFEVLIMGLPRKEVFNIYRVDP
ncbi:hypothetical protein, partial [Pseudovibrio sp. W64]|uniref:hypothetical protein n=1 Tax=Pseudovibrio sp. W64 TaxID=1735583 RepID=UPI0019D37631